MPTTRIVEMPERDPEQLLTPEEVARRLIVSPKTVRAWLRKGKMKGVRAGSLWRVREKDLEAFLKESTEKKWGEF